VVPLPQCHESASGRIRTHRPPNQARGSNLDAESDEELEAALRRELPRNEKPDSCKSEAAYDKDELGAFIRSCKAAHATKVGGRPPKLFFVKIRSLGSAFTATDGVTERACRAVASKRASDSEGVSLPIVGPGTSKRAERCSCSTHASQ